MICLLQSRNHGHLREYVNNSCEFTSPCFRFRSWSWRGLRVSKAKETARWARNERVAFHSRAHLSCGISLMCNRILRIILGSMCELREPQAGTRTLNNTRRAYFEDFTNQFTWYNIKFLYKSTLFELFMYTVFFFYVVGGTLTFDAKNKRSLVI